MQHLFLISGHTLELLCKTGRVLLEAVFHFLIFVEPSSLKFSAVKFLRVIAVALSSSCIFLARTRRVSLGALASIRTWNKDIRIRVKCAAYRHLLLVDDIQY